MTKWMLALKRVIRGKLFLLSLLLAALVMAGTSMVGERTVEPLAGFAFSAPGGKITADIRASMVEVGLLPYDSPESLRSAVSDGEIDCGILLHADLEEMVKSGELEEAATVLISGSTSFPKFFAGVAGSALFSAAVPHMATQTLADFGFSVTSEEVEAEYKAQRAEGDLFTFRSEYLSGKEPIPTEEAFGENLFRTALALLLFVAVVPESYRSFRRELATFTPLLGSFGSLRHVFIPLSVFRFLFSLLAVAGGIALGHLFGGKALWGLLWPAAVYLLLLFAAGFLLSVLLPVRTDLRVLLPVWLFLSLILCPVYTDLGEWFPVIRPIRLFFPPTWFWQVEESPYRSLLAALGIFLAASGLFALVRRRFHSSEEA